MIERLRGVVVRKEAGKVLLDVGGVGYAVHVTDAALNALGATGEETVLETAFIVREDAMALYGFRTQAERQTFEVFLSVSGIGPHVALDVLNTVSIPELVSAIGSGRTEVLTRVPGIGRKRAERLILELKDRLKRFPAAAAEAFEQAASGGGAAAAAPNDVSTEGGDPYADATAALQALGFKPAQAARQVAAAMRETRDENLSVEELVRRCLQASR